MAKVKIKKTEDNFGLNYLKIEDVIKVSTCSKRHVMEEIRRKNLRAFKPGKLLLFRIEDVEKWISKKVAS